MIVQLDEVGRPLHLCGRLYREWGGGDVSGGTAGEPAHDSLRGVDADDGGVHLRVHPPVLALEPLGALEGLARRRDAHARPVPRLLVECARVHLERVGVGAEELAVGAVVKGDEHIVVHLVDAAKPVRLGVEDERAGPAGGEWL